MSSGSYSNQTVAPRVVLDELVYQKIMHWVNKSNYEVSGLGKVVVENGEIRIIDAILLPQRNTGSTTDIEGADVAKAMYLLRDTPGDLRFWWHSHVNMGVFWSGTDMATIKELGQHGWFVHTVFNKRRETRTAISMGDPFPAIIDDIKLVIERSLPVDLVASWDKEYDDKVTNIVPKLIPTHGSRFPHQVSGQILSKEDSDYLRRLAKMMEAEDNLDIASTTLESSFSNSFQDLGSDGVYGDSDWPGSTGGRSEHSKGGTPQDVLKRRDTLEAKIEKYEDRVQELVTAGAAIPNALRNALDQAIDDLNEVEDELDVLEQHGMIHNVDRYGSRSENDFRER
jgi:hypothetical protein